MSRSTNWSFADKKRHEVPSVKPDLEQNGIDFNMGFEYRYVSLILSHHSWGHLEDHIVV